MHTKSELLECLRDHGLRLQKRLGQHFLVDPHLAQRAVGLCALSRKDTVIEIGAGLGALTDLLAARAARVLALELDAAIAGLLEERMQSCPNVKVLAVDVRTFEWSAHPDSTVVGMIPYALTSEILAALCAEPVRVPAVWLGLQAEVAARLVARPATKAYGRLTVLVQYRFEVTKRLTLPRRAFFPQPEVDSAWVELRRRAVPGAIVQDERWFFEVVRAAFSQRRKTLLNCLTHLRGAGLERAQVMEALARLGLPAGVRGEALSLEAFGRLAEALSASRRVPLR